MPSTSQREVNDLIPEFIWLSCGPDEPQVIEDGADIHAPRELDDTWNMAPERQVVVEMAWHGGAIVGNQQTTVSLDPAQDLRIRRAPGRGAAIVDGIYAQVRRYLRQLHLDERRDVLVEQEADPTHAGAAT